jgi:hypothetical protein
MRDLAVENVPCIASRLLQDDSPILGVGVVSEIRAFVHETLAIGIDHDGEGVSVSIEEAVKLHVTEIRRVALP